MTYIIYKDGTEINRIEADEAFTRQYCEDNGYTWELPPEPEPGPEPEPEPTDMELLQIAVAELAEAMDEQNTQNQLAIAELAEAMMGGDTDG